MNEADRAFYSVVDCIFLRGQDIQLGGVKPIEFEVLTEEKKDVDKK
jgi:hypothetical protein